MSMTIVGDTHTHTLVCQHAMGTLTENIQYAAKLGHRFLGCTEHCGNMPYSPPIWYFNNMLRNLPDVVDGVVMVKGAETNCTNIKAEIDFSPEMMKKLHLVICSAHNEDFDWRNGLNKDDFTEMYCRLAENPLVDVIGHSGDPRFQHDHEKVVQAYKKYDKIVEVNSSSIRSRPGSEENCRDILKYCKQYGVKITLGSDAHAPQFVGHFTESIQMLEEMAFPEELVVNADYERFRQVVYDRHELMLPD